VKRLSQPDTVALLENNYSLQMIETGLRSSVRPLTGRPFINLFENFSENSLKGDLSNNTADNPLLFSLVNSLKPILNLNRLQ
jgi:hypothetical protein